MDQQRFNNGVEYDHDDDNGGDTTLEEQIYWANFKSMRFFLSLSPDFLTHLVIPKKFSENMGDKLPQNLVLKGPGGATSAVRLVRDSHGTLLFKDGWKEFAEAHRLKEKDLLMFKYTRNSYFKVWIFDKRNLCENAGSYFVRNLCSGNKTVAENTGFKRKTRTSSAEAAVEEEGSYFQGSDLEWDLAGTSRRKGHRQSDCSLRKSQAQEMCTVSPLPNRKHPTAEEKERALRMALAESTKDSFFVVMRSGNVNRYLRLCVPAAWAKNNLSRKAHNVELQVKEKKWTTRYNTNQRSSGGVFVTGWNKFVRDNSLQEYDVCLFKLASQIKEPPTIDVLIFYAGEVIRPS